MVMVRTVMTMAVYGPCEVFFQTMRMPVVQDHLLVFLEDIHHSGDMRRRRHYGPEQHGHAEKHRESGLSGCPQKMHLCCLPLAYNSGRLRRLALSPRGGYGLSMSDTHIHASHPALIARLKRADGHLRAVIAMLEAGKPCVDVAQQLQAVEKAVMNAKRVLIHDHIDHCLEVDGSASDRAELKTITRYL